MSENIVPSEIDTFLAVPKEALLEHIEKAIEKEPHRKYNLLMLYTECLLRQKMNIDILPNIYAQITEESDDENLVALAYWTWGLHLIEVSSDLDGGIEKIDKARTMSEVYHYSIIKIISTNLKEKDYDNAAIWCYCLSKDPKYSAVGLQMLGKAFMLMKNYESAIGALEESLDIEENNPDTLLLLSDAYEKIDEKEASLEYKMQFLQIKPDDTEVLVDIAIYYHMAEDFYRAMEYYTRAIKIEPNNARLYLNVAKLYLTVEEDYSGSIEYLNKVVALIDSEEVNIKTQINTYGLLTHCHKQLTHFEEMNEYALKFAELSKLDNEDSSTDNNNPNIKPSNEEEE